MAAERRARAVWEGRCSRGRGVSPPRAPRSSPTSRSRGRRGPRIPEGGPARRNSWPPLTRRATPWPSRPALARKGTPAEGLEVTATCAFDKVGEDWGVTTMYLHVRGRVPGLDRAAFEEAARAGEEGCPISNAIRGNVEIRLTAELEG